MQILNEQDRRRVILAVSLLAGIVVLVAILGFMGVLAPLYHGMWEILGAGNSFGVILKAGALGLRLCS